MSGYAKVTCALCGETALFTSGGTYTHPPHGPLLVELQGGESSDGSPGEIIYTVVTG